MQQQHHQLHPPGSAAPAHHRAQQHHLYEHHEPDGGQASPERHGRDHVQGLRVPARLKFVHEPAQPLQLVVPREVDDRGQQCAGQEAQQPRAPRRLDCPGRRDPGMHRRRRQVRHLRPPRHRALGRLLFPQPP
ncbi:hypothetical protein D477_020193 [Arthrobacter crystallopoietes BAB-32]|uniref:Uncharacterized protein n=1 Tax=Arthrobacter crystallopoietes BAB-32 TaxID=1246476 RepID=N1V2F5_9MICC|nr:hypothetical protein D477_020193 [Arthrobacter crystallopoietes BAB-32]